MRNTSIAEIWKSVLGLLKAGLIEPKMAKLIMWRLIDKRIDNHAKRPTQDTLPGFDPAEYSEEEVPF